MTDIEHWQTTARAYAISHDVPDNRLVDIWGSSVEDTAEITLELIRHIHSKGGTFKRPLGTLNCRDSVPLEVFTQTWRNYRMYVRLFT
jgi:hypothetical protein